MFVFQSRKWVRLFFGSLVFLPARRNRRGFSMFLRCEIRSSRKMTNALSLSIGVETRESEPNIHGSSSSRSSSSECLCAKSKSAAILWQRFPRVRCRLEFRAARCPSVPTDARIGVVADGIVIRPIECTDRDPSTGNLRVEAFRNLFPITHDHFALLQSRSYRKLV